MPVLTTLAVSAGTAATKAAIKRRQAVQRGEKEAIADIVRRRFNRDEEGDDEEIGVDPEVLATAAEAAVKAAKLVAKLKRQRDEAIEAGEEPLISDEDIKAAAVNAKRKMQKARALKEADAKQKKARGFFKGRVSGDGERPPSFEAPEVGAVVWGTGPRPKLGKRKGSGLSLYDPGLGGGSVKVHLDPMKLSEASEILLALTRVNIAQMQAGVPSVTHGIYEGHIRYKRRPEGTVFTTLRGLYEQGGGDCGPLAAAYAAERTLQGHPSVPYLYFARPGVIHAVVRDIKTGDLYDPSRLAGMGQE